jgi:hypothetical protein
MKIHQASFQTLTIIPPQPRSHKDLDIMSKNGDPSMNPFNKFEMSLIDLFSTAHHITLIMPNQIDKGDAELFGDSTARGLTHFILASTETWSLNIVSRTGAFYAKALLFLSTYFGNPGKDKDGNILWEFPENISEDVSSKPNAEPDYEAMVEAHLESQAEIARGK